MATMEVRNLVAKFESNRKSIRILQTKKDRLRRDYSNAWNKIRLECEKAGHDNYLNDNKIFRTKHLCPYCRKQVFPVKWYCDSWTPDSIFDPEYCKYWLDMPVDNWPPLKQDMLKRIKYLISIYFADIKPIQSRLDELHKEQEDIKNKLQEIFKLCDSVLKITEGYEEALKKNKP